MARPRGFDEDEVIRRAVDLFATRAYDGVSVDDIVVQLGVHRNSLYKTFGSKRGLYLAALRRQIAHDLPPFLESLAAASDGPDIMRRGLSGDTDLGMVLMAAWDQAPEDCEVAAEIARVLHRLDQAVATALGDDPQAAALAPALLTILLGLRLRLRLRVRVDASATELGDAAAVLAGRLTNSRNPTSEDLELAEPDTRRPGVGMAQVLIESSTTRDRNTPSG